MSNFIKLTLLNGNAVFANVDFIGHITEDTYQQRGYDFKCTRICLTTNNNGGMQIKESIAEVLLLIGKPEQEPVEETDYFAKKVNNRMELIMDDVNDIRRYINRELAELLPEEKETLFTHLSNIEIASDLSDTEADAWYIIKKD